MNLIYIFEGDEVRIVEDRWSIADAADGAYIYHYWEGSFNWEQVMKIPSKRGMPSFQLNLLEDHEVPKEIRMKLLLLL